MSHPATGHQPTPQPSPAIRYLKLTLAVISVAIGGLMLLVSVFTLDFPMILIALAIGIPGGWWFLHERKAKAGTPMKRHWGAVAAVAIVAFIGGGVLLPDAEPTDEAIAAVETTSAAQTSTTTSTPRPTSTTSKATSTSTKPTTATSTTTEPEPKPEETPARRDPEPQRAVAPAPTPAPAYTPPPAPAPAPNPAPAPAPAPVPESPGAVTGRTVTPGAFCKDIETGMTGQTSTGLTVTCTKAPGEDRSRWRA
jgi:outer membrane biosynthesis protein TonB